MKMIDLRAEYQQYINELKNIVRPELINTLNKLSELDPKIFIKSDNYVVPEHDAFYFVWSLFIYQLKKSNQL